MPHAPRARSSALPFILGALALFLALATFGSAGAATGSSSPDGLWREIQKTTIGLGPTVEMIDHPVAYRVYQLDTGTLEGMLASTPLEFTTSVRGGVAVMTVPLPDGSFGRFQLIESPILSPTLQAEFPDYRTYIGQGLDDPTAIARFDRTPQGFHAQILSAAGTVIVDPYSFGDTRNYVTFWKHDLRTESGDFSCLNPANLNPSGAPIGLMTPSGANLRTYRLAMTATGEYTQFFGGHAAAQAQIVTTVNRIVGIYEREVAIRMNIVFFNIYDNASTDPFPAGASIDDPLLSQNQADLNTNVPGGAGGYDLGHIVSRGGGGGLAYFGVCDNTYKGRAGTSRGTPSGDAFDVDFVAHEMGHQFHGDHTFNGTTGSCSGGNREATSAYEPGSGTTIMAYAGICGAENVQPNSDPFFHTRSFDQIVGFREGGGTCGPSTATGNSPPNVNAGADHTIPTGTPFRLTASGTDPDGHPLTFCWEQFDLGSSSPPANNANGPMFRSPVPTVSPMRVCPKMSTVLSGVADPWERLPTVARDLNFRATARDNRAGGGGVNYDAMVVHVTGAPFFVTSPNGGGSVTGGCPITVTWTVGGGNVAANVNILFSANGGATFALLLPNTANDGSEAVTLPCAGTSQGRIMVEAADNIFFDVSNGNFTVAGSAAPVASVVATGGSVNASCQRLVSFSGNVSDDCSILASDVAVTVSLLAPNAVLGAPSVTLTQVDASHVGVSGTVMVSSLAGPPAIVRVRVSGTDGCGLGTSAQDDASVFDDSPPVALCPGNISVECSSHTGTPVADPAIQAFLNAFSATDNCTASPARVNNAPATFAHGLTTVMFTATDNAGNSAHCSAQVNVIDTTPPVVTCPVDLTLECDSHCDPSLGGVPASDAAVVAWLGSFSAYDVCDPTPATSLPHPACFPLGDTPVTFTATDDDGNSNSCTRVVHVVDTTPPTIALSLDRTVLWPPNHKLATINATVAVADICDPNPTFQLVSIVSNEPDNGLGDGDTANDIQGAATGTADTQFQLRAERSGGGSGRKYTIMYRAFDHSGNHADAVAVVRVPHDQSGSAIAADGWDEDGTAFAPGAQSFAVVIRSVPRVVVDEGGEISDLQVGSTGTAGPGANELTFSARAVDERQAYVGNGAGVLNPVASYYLDADGDSYTDLVCFYRVTDAVALQAISSPEDGPVGLHYNTWVGAEYLVEDLFALGTPIKLPSLGWVTVAGTGRGTGRLAGGVAPDETPVAESQAAAVPETAAPSAPAGGGSRDGMNVPEATELAGVYPNPMQGEATVVFSLAREQAVELAVYDVRGARVRTLERGTLAAGRYQMRWNGRDDAGRSLTGGMYFVRFNAGSVRSTRKTIIMP